MRSNRLALAITVLLAACDPGRFSGFGAAMVAPPVGDVVPPLREAPQTVALPAPLLLAYRATRDLPYEVVLERLDGMQLRFRGTTRFEPAAEGRLRQNSELDRLTIEGRGQHAATAVRAVFSVEIGTDGSAWTIAPPDIDLPQTAPPGTSPEEWRRLRAATLATWMDPRTHLLRCLATPSYPSPSEPARFQEGRMEWLFPPTLGPCLSAALRGGLLASETAKTREMARTIGEALARDPIASVDGTLRVRSNLALVGMTSDGTTRELAIVSGEIAAESLVPRVDPVRLGVEVLIDPYLGIPVRQQIDARALDTRAGPFESALADLPRVATFITHATPRIPGEAEAGVVIRVEEAPPRPTIAEIYRASVDGVFTVVSPLGSGSGFAIAPDVIVTAGHLVEGAEAVWVISHSGAALPAEVIPQTDATIDVAFLRVTADDALPALDLSGELPGIGTPVVAIGTALGILEGTLTAGVIGNVKAVDDHHMLVFDAAVNPGNSGGPLLGPDGKVIGMVVVRSAVEKGIIGLNFALFAGDIRDAYRTLAAAKSGT